jgi:hypothetical protein
MTLFNNSIKTKPTALKSVTEVGWTMVDTRIPGNWGNPEPFARNLPKATTSKSVQVCPAAVDFDARYYVLKCPIDLHIHLVTDHINKTYRVEFIQEQQISTANEFLKHCIKILPISEWKHPDRPVLQILTPYTFLSDDCVYINQSPPFMDYFFERLPGLIFSKRFPIHLWPAQLTWTFEWQDVSQPISIKQGTPWFYVHFESSDPSRRARLVDASLTESVKKYIYSLTDLPIPSHVTDADFQKAIKRKPPELLFLK